MKAWMPIGSRPRFVWIILNNLSVRAIIFLSFDAAVIELIRCLNANHIVYRSEFTILIDTGHIADFDETEKRINGF
jgi:hypothetical protein